MFKIDSLMPYSKLWELGRGPRNPYDKGMEERHMHPNLVQYLNGDHYYHLVTRT